MTIWVLIWMMSSARAQSDIRLRTVLGQFIAKFTIEITQRSK